MKIYEIKYSQLGCEDVAKMHSELVLFNYIMAQKKSNFTLIFILLLDQLFSVTLWL